ncbi:MAG: radical SAM protein [Mariprofundaceae bacterium]|nr:radical SAM protein [Mariprofundaceae bacterium]
MSKPNQQASMLNTHHHSRDSAGFRYVYPVVSRRARGVSVGINLNPNHCCNWHCVYCQVPSLSRGHAPVIDVQQLQLELDAMLYDILHGCFMEERVPEGHRVLRDIAFSGNGEPSSSKQFQAIVNAVIELKERHALKQLPLRLITNGSYMRHKDVQQAMTSMSQHQGEIWIKVDAGTGEDSKRTNGVSITREHYLNHVEIACRCCPTWIQSCFFDDDQGRTIAERRAAYLALLQQMKSMDITLHGVLLYGLARPSLQKEAKDLRALPHAWMQSLATDVRCLGFDVQLH